MLYLNENASKLWYDNIYIWIISVSLGMNEISQRQRFALHFTVFPWCCSFSQRRDTQEQTPRGPGCCQNCRQGPCLPLLPPAAGEQELVLKSKRYGSLCSTSELCGFLRACIELHSPILVGFVVVVVWFFFNLSTRSGTETINSFHWQSHSQLKSATATSASTRVLPPASAVPAPMGTKIRVSWCERGFFIKKAVWGASLDTHYTSLCPSWWHIN